MQRILLTFLLFSSVSFSQEEKNTKEFGLDVLGGTFGLFNVNDVFTKADYTLGASVYADFGLHQNFTIGAEQMLVMGKPKTADGNRMILNTNARFKLRFPTFEKIHFNILIAGGFSFWPGNSNTAYLTPTLNDTRLGWDFRASANADFILSEKISLVASFGYLASSSTSDDIVWITHDSMLISFGPKLKF
ncbi:MAG: outer membrane beta-barrel protein [Crocinitomicaceae bacterium]|nr:outer membrane beta-barrel protein [Crocinitomicaceae bacterium]